MQVSPLYTAVANATTTPPHEIKPSPIASVTGQAVSGRYSNRFASITEAPALETIVY